MRTYEKAIEEIKEKATDLKEVINQVDCEYEADFLGFADNYHEARKLIPAKDYIVIDIGCYLATQGWLFTEFNGYVGVDVTKITDSSPATKRCCPDNAMHFEMNGQAFLREKLPLFGEKVFVIMSAVPDFELADIVWEMFDNCYIAYPGKKTRRKVNGKKV